jgi:hypothetical protein
MKGRTQLGFPSFETLICYENKMLQINVKLLQLMGNAFHTIYEYFQIYIL